MSTPRRDTGRLRPTVEHYLRTGEIAIQRGDNSWMELSLLDSKAKAARAAWLEGDIAGAYRLLAQCHYMPGWFVQ